MDGCLDDDAVLAYVGGAIADEVARTEVVEHLDRCRECRVRVAAAAGGGAALDEAGAEGAAPQPAASDPNLAGGGVAGAVPATIGRFEVQGVAGRGAMGIVYEGRDPRLGRAVALKVIQPAALGPDAHARLEREARALARIDHPHVVRVYEVGDAAGATFIAMEYVCGQTLEAWLRAAPRTRAEILARFTEAGEGLLAAHRCGLVHRDFKPSNVMIDDAGRAKVTDFGLVRDGADDRPATVADPEDLSLTRTGMVLGTPAYMAPEQLAARPADAGADQFGFCVALFEALAGHRPFEAADLPGLVAAVRAGRPAAPRRPMPRRLHKALRRGLAQAPADRFPSMRELLDQLAAHRRARRLYAGAALGVVGAAAVAAAALWPEPARAVTPCSDAEARWAAVWTDERRAALRAAITEDWPAEPPADAAPAMRERWQGLGRLDASFAIDGVRRFGEDWRSRYQSTCADGAGGSGASARLRRACLTDALGRLEAIVTDPPGGRFDEALTEVSAHRDRCSTHVLAALELPGDEAFALVEQARTHLATAAGLRWRRQNDEATVEVDAAMALAERAGYQPVLAEAWLERAMIARQSGDMDAAIEASHRAIALAQPSAYHRIVRQATDMLAWQYYFGKTDLEQARRWLASAEQLDAFVPPTPYEQVLRATLRAQLTWRAGDGADAVRLMEAAYRDVIEHRLGRELAVRTLEGIVVLLFHGRRFDEVEPWLDELERSHGAHPMGAELAARHRGQLAAFRGDHATAAGHFERAAALAQAPAARADLLLEAGDSHSRAGRRAEAERALAAAEAAGGDRVRTRLACGQAGHLQRFGDAAGSVAPRRECIRRREAEVGPLQPVVIFDIAQLGYTYRELGNDELAIEYFDRAIERFEQLGRNDDPVNALRFDLARLLFARDPTRARSLARRAAASLSPAQAALAEHARRWLRDHAR